MHFLAFVIGENEDEQLSPFVSSQFEFIVNRELEVLCNENGLPYTDTKVLNVVRDYVGRNGKIAIVAKERVPQECPDLYRSGIEDFLTVEDGKFFTINKILLREGAEGEAHRGFEKARQKIASNATDKEQPKGPLVSESQEGVYIDGYTVGGEWENFLVALPGKKGRRGPNTEKRDGHYDKMRVKDIDFDKMFEEATEEAQLVYDKVQAIIAGRPVVTFEEYLAKHDNVRQATQAFQDQPVVKELNTAGHFFLPSSIFHNREDFLYESAQPLILPHAVIKDGVWHQRGTLSWFGMVENAKSWREWAAEVKTLIEEASPTAWLTVVDCHR